MPWAIFVGLAFQGIERAKSTFSKAAFPVTIRAMPLLVLILLLAVFAYLWVARRNSTLTRACLWRQERSAGQWRCAACGAVLPGEKSPRVCLAAKE